MRAIGSMLLFLSLSLSVAGCDLGTYTGQVATPPDGAGAQQQPPPGSPDAAPPLPPGTPDAQPAAPAPDAAPVVCDKPAAANGSGKHNAGRACAACHDGANAPLFTIGGTLYADVAGATPLAGATIHVIDGAGTDIKLVTAANGNFYSAQAIAYPVHVTASSCPNTVPMIGAVASPGNCNAGGCHDSARRMHLP